MSKEAKQHNKTLHRKHLEKPLDHARINLTGALICRGQSRAGIWRQSSKDGDNDDDDDSDSQLLLVTPRMSDHHSPRHFFIFVHSTMARKKTVNNTTPSQDAMLEHLAYLVLHQNRPACWRDFQNFMVDGQAYSLKQGTIRN